MRRDDEARRDAGEVMTLAIQRQCFSPLDLSSTAVYPTRVMLMVRLAQESRVRLRLCCLGVSRCRTGRGLGCMESEGASERARVWGGGTGTDRDGMGDRARLYVCRCVEFCIREKAEIWSLARAREGQLDMKSSVGEGCNSQVIVVPDRCM